MITSGSRGLARFTLLALAGALAGCHSVAPPPPTLGRSSFEFVRPTPSPSSQKRDLTLEIPENEEYNEAKPILPLAEPIYPPAALAGHAGTATFDVRLTIDSDGRVAEVEPSLVSLALPIPFSAAFRRAIEEAVAQWRFHPAEVVYLAPVPNADQGGSYLRVSRRETVAAISEVTFTFSTTGKVTHDSRPKSKAQ